jgi:hypothetical protein
MKVADQKARCPVRPGDIWRIGPHYFGCGDIEDGRVLARLLELADPLTLVYADPPWTSSNATWYRTISERDGKKGHQAKWDTVTVRAIRPAIDRRLLCYIEMGYNNRDECMAMVRRLGGRTDKWWNVHYDWTEACVFSADFRPEPGPIVEFDKPHGWKEPTANTPPGQAFAFHEPGVVLDPCSGEGWTARASTRLGWKFVGHELTPRRLWMGMREIGPESEHEFVENVVHDAAAPPRERVS